MAAADVHWLITWAAEFAWERRIEGADLICQARRPPARSSRYPSTFKVLIGYG